MSEYFIRLATLLGTDFPEKLPVLGYIAKNVGVRQWRETWNDDAVVVSAEAVIDAAISWEKGGFQFSVGNAVAGQTFFRIEIASDRSSLLTAIADRGEEMAGIVDPPPREGLQIFARADSPLAPSRIQLHDLDLRIRLPKDHALKGKREGNRIKPIADQAAEIAFMRGTLIIAPDAPKPIQFVPDDDEAVVIDPIYLPNLDIGIEVDKFKLDMSEESGIPEVLARPGYDETWTGLYLETFRIYGMHMLFPTLPEKIDPNDPADLIIELSRVVIGFDDGGVSGSLRVQMHTPANDPQVIRGAGFVVELERGNLIRCEVELTLRLERIADPNGPIDHDLQIIGSARFSPDGRLGWDLALNTPNTADEGLLSYGPDAVASIEAVIAAVLLADDLKNGEYLDAILLAGLATLLVKLQHDQQLGFKRLTLDALKLRYREELVAGRILKYLDLIADIQLLISLDLELSALPVVGAFLPNIKTDPGHPLGLLMKGLRVSLAYNIDDFTEAELGADRKVITVGWPSDYLFDLSGQSLMPNSPLVLTKFGFGRWDEGVWVDFGLKVAANDPSTAFSVIPHVFRLYFLANGDFDHATFEGLSVSILVPGVLFMRGRLNLGETITEAALQGWFVSAPGLSLTAYEKRENWQWDVGAQYREATLPDGTETAIVFAWLKTSSGIPNPLLPGTALYGGHFLYGNNSRPALGGDTIEKWFTDHEPKNQIEIDKWEGNLDSTAIGFGLVLGTQVDRGRPWNLQLGLLWADSQWLLHGYLNIFKQRPDPAETASGFAAAARRVGSGRRTSVRLRALDGEHPRRRQGDETRPRRRDPGGRRQQPDALLRRVPLASRASPQGDPVRALRGELLPDAGRCRRRELRRDRPDASGIRCGPWCAVLDRRRAQERPAQALLLLARQCRSRVHRIGSDADRRARVGGRRLGREGLRHRLRVRNSGRVPVGTTAARPTHRQAQDHARSAVAHPEPALHARLLRRRRRADRGPADVPRRPHAHTAAAERCHRTRRWNGPAAGPRRSGFRTGVFISDPQRRSSRRQLRNHRGRTQRCRYHRHA